MRWKYKNISSRQRVGRIQCATMSRTRPLQRRRPRRLFRLTLNLIKTISASDTVLTSTLSTTLSMIEVEERSLSLETVTMRVGATLTVMMMLVMEEAVSRDTGYPTDWWETRCPRLLNPLTEHRDYLQDTDNTRGQSWWRLVQEEEVSGDPATCPPSVFSLSQPQLDLAGQLTGHQNRSWGNDSSWGSGHQRRCCRTTTSVAQTITGQGQEATEDSLWY